MFFSCFPNKPWQVTSCASAPNHFEIGIFRNECTETLQNNAHTLFYWHQGKYVRYLSWHILIFLDISSKFCVNIWWRKLHSLIFENREFDPTKRIRKNHATCRDRTTCAVCIWPVTHRKYRLRLQVIYWTSQKHLRLALKWAQVFILYMNSSRLRNSRCEIQRAAFNIAVR